MTRQEPIARLYAVKPEGAVALSTPSGATDVHELFDSFALGIYEGLSTYEHTKFLHLERHFERAERSMEMLGWDHLLDRQALRRALHQACAEWPLPEARVRFDVLAEAPPGVGSRVLLAFSPQPSMKTGEGGEAGPRSVFEQGVRVDVAQGKRRERPRIKLAQWVLDRRGTGPGDRGFFEHVLIDEEGRILEGSSSNVFGVRAGGLVTAGSGILEGLMRRMFLELADELAIPVVLEATALEDVGALDEAFLTSSTRPGVPIVEIAGRRVGVGKPGPLLRKLRAAFEELARREARPPLPRQNR
ncbi:MAG: aminotransferase class IV [Planctomycetota bacterium]|nr:aminotransferase class IV [Planctomycetota bacterium]